jgi:biopolymer transport protein ExbD
VQEEVRMQHSLQPVKQPMMELNTTPLIDVMLVLLIMFIITIPLQTHAVKLDLPSCSTCPHVNAFKNEIVITHSGVILWNGEPISEAGLRYDLRLTQQMKPEPELHLRPAADARYEVVDRVLATIKNEHVEKFGFVGNEAYTTL